MASDVKVPDWLLEKLAAGELSPTRAEALRARLHESGEEGRLAAIADSNAAILAALPPVQVVREIERRAASAAGTRLPRRIRLAWALPLAAACAASIVVVVSLHRDSRDDSAGADEVRIKGNERVPILRIYRKTKSGPELLPANAEASKGDTLQIRYLAAGKRFGVIASVDGRGTVTFHLPEAPGQAAALVRNGEHALAHSYELDDSPKFERFLFVTSDAPFPTDEVARSLREGSKPPLPLTWYEFPLRKSP